MIVMNQTSFGNWITERQAAQGLNHAALAAKVGITARTLLAWQKGENKPRVNHIGKLSAALGVSVGEVMERVGK